MKCFVHMDFDPVPKQVNSPVQAITLAEAVLKAESEEEPDSKLQILWRRDEFYPNNFYEYTQEKLVQELAQNGSVVLQLVKTTDEFPVLGESITIFTEEVENKFVEQAENALEYNEENLDRKPVHIRGETPLIKRTRNSKLK